MTRIRFCSECGLNPKPSMVSISSKTETHLEHFKDIKEKSSSSNKHRKKNISFKKISHLTIGIAVVWWLIAGLIIYSAKTIWPEKIQQKSTPTYDSKKIDNHANLALEKENLLLINKSVEGCMKTLKEFFQATLPEERNQHVIQSFDSPIRIEKYHNIENLNLAGPPTLEHSQWSVVDIAEEKAIEATWTNNEGRRFEAIFRKEREEWLIDWEHFVRYSDMPLAVFLSGNGDAEGEFRLLARERLAEERKDLPTISIMFYAPIFGWPWETEMSSPEFLIERNSPEGVLLQAAFSELKNKKRPFNAKLANYDPEGMIRVRVKIRRSGEADSRAFKIVELKACHWYSSDLSGLDVASGSETKNPD